MNLPHLNSIKFLLLVESTSKPVANDEKDMLSEKSEGESINYNYFMIIAIVK